MADRDQLSLMAHLMRRAGFGAGREELESRVAAGYEATVEELVNPERQPPIDEDIYEMAGNGGPEIKSTPDSLAESINALEADFDFLLRGSVFTEDLIQVWMNYKRAREVDYIRLRPHPGEFALYYDV